MMKEAEVRRSPYQGLIPYDEKDAPFFFGRETEKKIIIANLFASPLTLLYSESGVGKSSVLGAGVAYELRQRDDLLVIVFSEWKGEPLGDLKAAVNRAIFANESVTTPPTPLREERSDPLSQAASLSEYLIAWSKKLNCRLMIILDQFEEYSLYHPQDDAFAREFPRAVLQSEALISFVISIREDSLAKLDRFEGHIPTLFDNYLRIEPLSREAGRAAILKPIEEYNRLNLKEPPVTIEPALVEAILEQVKTGEVILGEAGQGMLKAGSAESQIEAPYLQVVMLRIWDEEMSRGSRRLRLKTLNELGGAGNIIRTHLDKAMSSLPPSAQMAAARVFHYLVTPSGAKIAHTVPDLADYAGMPQEQLSYVMEDLLGGEVRILRGVAPPRDQPNEPRYEIFHDVLIPAILEWRSRYVQAQEKAEAEHHAKEQKRRADEQAKIAKRLKRFLIALVIVSLMALGSLILAMYQQNEAAHRQQEAAIATANAEDARNIAKQEQALIAGIALGMESIQSREWIYNLVQRRENSSLVKQAGDAINILIVNDKGQIIDSLREYNPIPAPDGSLQCFDLADIRLPPLIDATQMTSDNTSLPRSDEERAFSLPVATSKGDLRIIVAMNVKIYSKNKNKIIARPCS